MGKMKGYVPFISFFLCLSVFSSLVAAEGTYRITANIISMQQVSYITGQVTDGQGNPVHPADVTFVCGAIQIKVSTIPGGWYIGNPPACYDYTIMATAPGWVPVPQPGVPAEPDQLVEQDLTLAPEISLTDAVSALKILSGSTPSTVPPDQNQDNKVGLAEAIYTLQVIRGLRGAARLQAPRQAKLLAPEGPKNGKLCKDKDGDGEDDECQEVTTDENGYLDISGLTNGTYSLTATGNDGNGAVMVQNIKIAGKSVHLKTVQLKPAANISGNIKLEGRTDHSDIHILIPGTSFDAYTDAEGNFTIWRVPEGTFNLRASKAGFATITIPDFPVNQGEESEIESVTLLSSAGEVTGTVWLQGLADYSGILITLRKDAGATYLTSTNAAGEYAFQDAATGDYSLSASYAGYLPVQKNITVVPGPNAQDSLLLKINTEKGSLRGTITLDKSDDYAGIQVTLAGTGYWAITDSSGAYSLEGIPKGTYTVFVKAEGYGAQRFEAVQIRAGETTPLDAALVASSGTNYGSIVGTATYIDRADHSGISLKVEGTGIPLAGTDSNGGFIINDVPAGTYTLLFTQANYKTVTRVGVEVVPWETTVVKTVELIPPVGNITGKVQLEGETSYDNATVSVDGTSISAQSLADGSFILEGVREGLVNITAYKAGFVVARVTGIKVLAGQTVNLESPIVLNRPPEPPTGLTALQASGTAVKVGWVASVSSDVGGYHVYFSDRSDLIDRRANPDLVMAPEGGKWQFTVTGLRKGVKYYFVVRAVDATQLESDPSQSVWAEIIPQIPVWPEVAEISYDGAFGYPQDAAISRDNLRAYVTNRTAQSVSVIDLTTGRIIAYYLVGDDPTGIVANPLRDEIYVVTGAGYVQIINSKEEIGPDAPWLNPSESMSGVALPQRAIVSPDGKYLFVSQEGASQANADRILVFDLDTRTNVLGEGQGISVGIDPVGMAIVNQELFVANSGSNTISVIDIDPASTTKWQVKGTIAAMSHPLDLAASPDGKFLYSANAYASQGLEPDEVAVIDTATYNVIKRITVGNYPYRMATGGSILYVVNYMDSNVSMINMESNEALSSAITVGNNPTGVAVTGDGEWIYVVNQGSDSLSIRKY